MNNSENLAYIDNMPDILTVTSLVKHLKDHSGGVTIMSKKEILKQVNCGALKTRKCGNKYTIDKPDFIEFWNNTINSKALKTENSYTQDIVIDDAICEALGL